MTDRKNVNLSLAGVVLFFWSPFLLAGSASPICLSHGTPLDINNDQVLQWKKSTPNQYHDRAHVAGTVVEALPNTNGHQHFMIQIGKSSDEIIEIIYNTEFGQMPEPSVGMNVEACGDYITATQQAGPYPPSPAGAIVHWVHMNPSGKGHDPGFLIVDGVSYGQNAENAGPKRLSIQNLDPTSIENENSSPLTFVF